MMKYFSLLVFLALSGCGSDDFADLKVFMEEAGKGAQPALEPMPPVKVVENHVYDAANLADPFKPRNLKPSKSGGANQPDMNRPKGPLEGFPLDALKMVGTIKRSGVLYALIKTPDGALYKVKRGGYMGQNFGRIVSINDAGVELIETLQDGTGDWIDSKANVALQE